MDSKNNNDPKLIFTTAEDPQIIEICRVLREEKYSWTKIEEVIFASHFRYLTGTKIHNGALSAALVKAHPELRAYALRDPNKKSKKKAKKGSARRRVNKTKRQLLDWIETAGSIPTKSTPNQVKLRRRLDAFCYPASKAFDHAFRLKVEELAQRFGIHYLTVSVAKSKKHELTKRKLEAEGFKDVLKRFDVEMPEDEDPNHIDRQDDFTAPVTEGLSRMTDQSFIEELEARGVSPSRILDILMGRE